MKQENGVLQFDERTLPAETLSLRTSRTSASTSDGPFVAIVRQPDRLALYRIRPVVFGA